jgi:hypothetical protein
MVESIGAEREGCRVLLSLNSLSAVVISLMEGSGKQSVRFMQMVENEDQSIVWP